MGLRSFRRVEKLSRMADKFQGGGVEKFQRG